jgi:hypothetical protein
MFNKQIVHITLLNIYAPTVFLLNISSKYSNFRLLYKTGVLFRNLANCIYFYTILFEQNNAKYMLICALW